jgi:hypothetical protein
MFRIITTLAAVLVTAGLSSAAQDGGTEVVSGGADSQAQLQALEADMSPREYKHAVRANRKLVRKLAKSYSTETLTAAGVPEAGIALLGAAAGLAVDGDARWHLNQSKTMAFSLDDVVSDDRALMFIIKKRW